MSWLDSLKERLARFVDRVDERIDKPAKERGTFTSGSEQMVDDGMARAEGEAVTNRRSGYGRGM